ncbi:MAG: hypothetical protein NW207_05770 [Cytophagales bacterium]|nr:hypothetical protein [Cytophagales bacterium]
MKNLIIYIITVFIFGACNSTRKLENNAASSDPTQRAKEYNYNYNHARSVVDYNVKHKKTRQKIANHNKEVMQDKLIKLNSGKKNPDNRHLPHSFRFYRGN